MSKVHNIVNYNPSSVDVFFFDNNIWMFLFCPIANAQKSKQQKYSEFFKKVNSAKACIWINSLVLSEFCNAWLQIEYKRWLKLPANVYNHNYKKDFVPSTTYKTVILEIKETLSLILNQTERASDNFNAVDLERIFAELDICDFNDSYYLELARLNKWKIVTDDADLFKNNNIQVDIITANFYGLR